MNATLSLAGFINPANMGYSELLIILAIVLIIFGPKKLPSLGRAMGKSIREFRDSMKGITSALEDEGEDDAPATRTADLDPKPVERKEESSPSSSGEEHVNAN